MSDENIKAKAMEILNISLLAMNKAVVESGKEPEEVIDRDAFTRLHAITRFCELLFDESIYIDETRGFIWGSDAEDPTAESLS